MHRNLDLDDILNLLGSVNTTVAADSDEEDEEEDIAPIQPPPKEIKLSVELPKLKIEGVPISFSEWYNAPEHVFPAQPLPTEVYQNGADMILSSSETIPQGVPKLNPRLTANEEELQTLAYIGAMFDYQDIFYVAPLGRMQTFQNITALHIVNHLLSDLDAKKQHTEDAKNGKPVVLDSGLTQTTVVVVCTNRHRAFKFIESILNCLPDTYMVEHYDEFRQEYFTEFPPKLKKHPDWVARFGGENDETFRIGLRFFNNKVSLKQNIDKSQLVVLSTLSVELSENLNFLSSVEVLVLDFADWLETQNQKTLQSLVAKVNCPLKNVSSAHDWSRLRRYYSEGGAAPMRQTIYNATVFTPIGFSLFNNQKNARGHIAIRPMFYPPLSKPTLFRIQVEQHDEIQDAISRVFAEHLMPQIQRWRADDINPGRTVIYFTSSYAFIMCRHILEKTFVQFLELGDGALGDQKKMLSAFGEDENAVLLITERYYFAYRPHIRDVERAVFIQPPTYPHFVGEITGSGSAIVYYTHFDEFALERVIGTGATKPMLTSTNNLV